LAGLLNFGGPDKLFFHFFQSFFERLSGPICPVESSLTEDAKGWQAFFSLFLKVF